MDNQPQSPDPKTNPHLTIMQRGVLVFGVIVIVIMLGFYIYAAYLSRVGYERAIEEARRVQEVTDLTQGEKVPSDWKTYTNTEYGFEFKYPGDWYYKDCSGVYAGFSYSESEVSKIICNSDGAQPHINIKTSNHTVIMDKYIQSYMSSLDNPIKETIIIDGQSAIKISGITKGPSFVPSGIENIGVVFEHNGNTHELYYFGFDNKDYSNILDQILSTFRFTR